MEFLEAVASSPWYRLIGAKPKLENGKVVVELDVSKSKHHQAFGTAHGGVLASVLDSAIGLNINVKLLEFGKSAVTVQLNIHYLKPIVEGKIKGIGEVVYIGSKIAVGYGEIIDERGEKIATGTATFYILEK